MSQPLKLAVAGLGRMGQIHALHVHELMHETETCQLTAVAEINPDRASCFLNEIGHQVPVFSSIEELARAGVCDATVIVTPTNAHREHAAILIAAGQRVLLEKPLTGTLKGDREFASELDGDYPNSLMLAFQRRFDAPLQYAKRLMDDGVIGRVFKIYSALEDSNPAPNGYVSGGILPDMSVHNVDEILWLTGRMPEAALSIGARIYSHRLTTSEEDFDDALLYMWFSGEPNADRPATAAPRLGEPPILQSKHGSPAGLVAQVQVGRNHVSGYRVETILFGEEGQIHVGRFEGKPFDIVVEAYGRRGRAEPLAYQRFAMRDYGRPLPEFVDRFGAAYKAELAAFIDCCRTGAEFPTCHRDGLRAQEVISAGMNAVIGRAEAARVASL